MDIVRDVAALRHRVRAFRAAGERVALVPTMGALHPGHLALVRQARSRAARVMVSIFVNPAQFGAGEDFDRYPRQEEADSAVLRASGCDLLFAPPVEIVYPAGHATWVRVEGLSAPLEGAHRPGHFDGVATVVLKLLLMAFPDVAVFGEKDWQQLAIIRRLVADLDLPIEILGCPTVREPDGVAMSSRNAFLTPEERVVAAALPRTLQAADRRLASAVADEATLEPLTAGAPGARLFVAARLGGTRLIDNWPVGRR